MEFEVFGIQADLDVRSHIAWSDTDIRELYEQINQPCVILVTCHRFEIYSIQPIDQEKIITRYGSFLIRTYTYHGEEAVRYLLEVVNGLHSQIFGEDEILRQVKEAYAQSERMHHCDSRMHQIFQQALHCGKEARSKYKMSEHPLSIGYIARQTMQKLEDKKVLLIGSGQIGQLILTYLKDENCTIFIANRNRKHAKELLEIDPQAIIVPFEERIKYAKQCDIICCATAAPHQVLDFYLCDHHTQLYDLASPRDIDPDFENQETVELYTLDTLAAISRKNEKIRKQELEKVKQLIETYVAKLSSMVVSEEKSSTLSMIHHNIDEVVEETFDYLDRKLDLTQRERHILRKTLQTSMLKLMKKPLKNIGTHYEELEPDTLQQLFGKEDIHAFKNRDQRKRSCFGASKNCRGDLETENQSSDL
ncbi:glutamyl-tRNA reductase [Firmicutes bacterium M10-2]|nr:glutamyl-tRNA reductase [Firmicutes bacterium M10-2]